MDIRKLLSLSIDEKGVKTLLDLPLPIDESLSEAESDDLYALAEKFYELWVQVLFAPNEFPCITQDESAAWAKTVRLIGTYYDFIFAQLLDREYFVQESHPIPAPHFGALTKSLEKNVEELIKLEESAIESGTPLPQKVTDQLRAQALFAAYISFRLVSPIYSILFGSVSAPAASFGAMTHASLTSILQGLVSPNLEEDHISFLACQLLANALQYLKEIYDARAQSIPWIWNKDHRKGDFSSINLPELALLASRDPGMATKYGEKAIERRFEVQVSLIMQTLGFYVIPTTPGSKTVDLICSPANIPYEEAYSFLVEAKTSGHNYSLPTKDSRAIQEYVSDTKRDLRTFLPPLRFVLIVGPAPTNTITKKLQVLESLISLPVRYCHAQILANLRESLRGPMPATGFLDQILSSSSVLSDDFFSPIIKAYNDTQECYSDFVKSMLSIARRSRR